MQPTSSLILALTAGLALVAAGCGSSGDTGAAKPAKAATVRKMPTAADQLSPNLVPAVVTGKSGAGLLQLKFEMAAPPALGETVDIDLVILPAADNVDRFAGTISGDDGLEVVAGGTIDPVEKPAYGIPVHHDLKVVAKRDGIYTLTAAMAVASGGEVLSPVFTMPVIGGNGQSDAGAAPAPGPNPARPPSAGAAH